ncbi:MAG: HD-GYP domain-containing protein, partial [Gammaproteobacteria bacterium]
LRTALHGGRVDAGAGRSTIVYLPDQVTPQAQPRPRPKRRATTAGEGGALPRRTCEYPDETAVERELVDAERAFDSLQVTYAEFVSALRNSGHGELDIEPLQLTVNDLQASILRNPDAMLLLCHLRGADSYTYRHAISSSVLAILFGRHLGLRRSQIHDLGMGMLLADIGKLNLPRDLLEAPRALTDDEFAIMRGHVEHSLAVLERSAGVSAGTRVVVRAHHERFNGRGYPDRLAGDDIPMLARLAGIVDTYDAMTNERVYARARSPLEAIQALYETRDVGFHGPLVEQFIQALGIYPVGTLVLLSSGEVAVVIGINRLRRLLPKVMMLLGADKQPLTHNRLVDLASQDDTDTPLSVREALPPGAFGISAADYYL